MGGILGTGGVVVMGIVAGGFEIEGSAAGLASGLDVPTLGPKTDSSTARVVAVAVVEEEENELKEEKAELEGVGLDTGGVGLGGSGFGGLSDLGLSGLVEGLDSGSIFLRRGWMVTLSPAPVFPI